MFHCRCSCSSYSTRQRHCLDFCPLCYLLLRDSSSAGEVGGGLQSSGVISRIPLTCSTSLLPTRRPSPVHQSARVVVSLQREHCAAELRSQRRPRPLREVGAGSPAGRSGRASVEITQRSSDHQQCYGDRRGALSLRHRKRWGPQVQRRSRAQSPSRYGYAFPFKKQ